MRYSILASNRTGSVRYYPQRWSWSLRNFGRAFGWQFLRDNGSAGFTVSFETLEQAGAYLEHRYEHRYEHERCEKLTRCESRLRWEPKKDTSEGFML